jgi:hypothetical protein
MAVQPPSTAQLLSWQQDMVYSMRWMTNVPTTLTIPHYWSGSDARYPSVCTCRPALLPSLLQCSPSHFSLVVTEVGDVGEDPDRLAALQSRLRWHLGPAWNFRVPDFSRVYLAASDHRSPDEAISGWGGDFGELLLALAVSESRLKRDMRSGEVKDFVRQYISASGLDHFFFGTDAEALSFVAVAAGLSELDPTSVVEPLQERVLLALTHGTGAGVGDPMLRWVVTTPQEFGVRRELVSDALRAFHQLLWRPPDSKWRRRIRYFVHRRPSDIPSPFAIVTVNASPDCVKEKRAIALPQMVGNPRGAVVTIHPQAVEARRRAGAIVVMDVSGGSVDTATKDLLSKGADWDELCITRFRGKYPGLPEVQLTAY